MKPTDNKKREEVLILFARAVATRPFSRERLDEASRKVKDTLGEGALTEAAAVAGGSELVTRTVDVVGKQPYSPVILYVMTFFMTLFRWVYSIFMKAKLYAAF